MKLIKKNIIFIFNKNYKEVFKEFKIRLTFISIFGYYDSEREIILELNILNKIIINIFSQLNLKDK